MFDYLIDIVFLKDNFEKVYFGGKNQQTTKNHGVSEFFFFFFLKSLSTNKKL